MTAPIHIVPLEAGANGHVPDRICRCSPRAMRVMADDSIAFVHRWRPQVREVDPTYAASSALADRMGVAVDDDDGDAA